MKKVNSFRTRFLYLFFIMILPLSACATTKLLEKLPSGRGVSRGNINEAMIKLGGAEIITKDSGYPFMGIIEKAKNIEIYSFEGDRERFQEIEKEFDKIMKRLDYEEMLTSEENRSINNIYIAYRKDAGQKNEREPFALIIYNSEGRSINIVVIQGKFNDMVL